MYREVARWREVVVFEDGADVSMTTLSEELARVSHGLIRPHVQPIVDLQSGAVVAYQGIARWDHPRHGMLEAGQFVHAVANTPLLPVIDLAVLRRTVAAAARAARNGVRVGAYGHVSRRLVGDIALERYLVEIVDDLGVAASDLRIEIAHALVARPSRTVAGALRALRDIGVRIVLSGVDGECEVNEIVEHGFDELRLAPAGARRVSIPLVDAAEGTVALARGLGVTVIAVGVESEDDRITMLEVGCDYGQGTHFGPVQPAGAVD
jgi:EAL domain-containing protein (putative c-di-GMP-specific phosphodiesterase class I)